MAQTRSGTRCKTVARALSLATVFLVSGCGATIVQPSSGTLQPGLASPPSPTALLNPATAVVTPLAGTRCGDSRGSRPEPLYAFPHAGIPLGSDACEDVGPFTKPNIPYLSNDGSRVAFNATDYANQGSIWYGDLTTDSVKVVYQAQQTASGRIGIESVQVVGDQLIWLEILHAGPYVSAPAKTWAVKDMDVSTHAVTVLSQSLAPAYGGPKLVKEIRFDGQQVAMAESTRNGWQIE